MPVFISKNHPGVPVTVKIGKSAINTRCGCTKRCRAEINEGDDIAFVRMQNPSLGGFVARVLTIEHFNRHFEEE